MHVCRNIWVHVCAFWVHVCGNGWVNVCGSWVQVFGYFWVQVYAFWVHVYAFWVHVYGSVGCMYAVVGCKVYGDVWVQSVCLLGASLIRLKACLIVGSCLTVGSYTLHVYPTSWAQGLPGARAQTINTIRRTKESN